MRLSRHIRRITVLLLGACIMGGLWCCGPGTPAGESSPPPAKTPTHEASAIAVPEGERYIDELFDSFAVERDIPYGMAADYQGREQTLFLDIYMPEGDTEEERPAIIWVHGGGFTEGTKEGGFEVNMAAAFAKKGFVCLSVNYRLRDERYSDWAGTLSDAVTDISTALAWTIGHSAEYGIDPARIALSGYSAGGTTVTGLAYNDGIDLPDNASRSAWVIINMAGGAYGMGGISPDAPPCLILHGTEDDTVPFMGGTQCAEALTAAGVENTFYVLDGVSHDLHPHIQEIEDVVTVFLYEELTGIKPDIPIRKGH